MIGKRLRNLREDADITQDGLAKILKINKYSISSYERDRSEPPDSVKIAMASFFGVSVDYLVGFSDNPSPHNKEKNYIRLPVKFPQNDVNKINEYIEFLMYKFQYKNKQ